MTATKRSLKVELSIQETGEGMYPSTTIVASQTIEVPLPASGKAVGAAVVRHLAELNSSVNEFRGPVAAGDPEPADELDTLLA